MDERLDCFMSLLPQDTTRINYISRWEATTTLLDRITRLISAEQLKSEKAERQGKAERARVHDVIRANTQRVYQDARRERESERRHDQ